MNMSPELIAYIVAQALVVAQQAYARFLEVNGRAPTLDEWKALEASWKSPAEIEQEVKAQGAQAPAPANS